MSKIAKTEASNKHNWKVLDLDMFDLMELSDEGVIDSKLFDDLYYHLLDPRVALSLLTAVAPRCLC